MWLLVEYIIQSWPQSSSRGTGVPFLSVQTLSNSHVLSVYFTVATLFPLYLAACLKDQMPRLSVLSPTGCHPHPSSSCIHRIVHADLHGAAKHRCRRHCGWRPPLVSHIIARRHFHLLNRFVFLFGSKCEFLSPVTDGEIALSPNPDCQSGSHQVK